MPPFATPESAKEFLEQDPIIPCTATVREQGHSYTICMTGKYDRYASAIVSGKDLDLLVYVAIEEFDKAVQRSERRRIRFRVRSQMYRRALECCNN